MSDTNKKLFLLDAYALIFRGYYAFVKNPRINSKGLNTSAILGFFNSLFDVLRRESPSHIGVCFDVGRASVRTDYFEEYKANRDETPEAIKIAVPYIQDVLKALNIPILFAEGYEADDVIGTLAKKAEKSDFNVFMMTSDKDFAQLVSGKVKMYKPGSRGGGPEVWGVKEVQEKFGVKNPIQVIDFLGMMGDSVDNIPGLLGVGEKTAKKFLAEYGSMENLLANTHELKGKQREKIEQSKELGLLSKKLATIITDVPVEFIAEDLVLETPDWESLDLIFEELEFRRLTENARKVYNKVQDTLIEGPTRKDVLQQGSTQTSLFGGDIQVSEKPDPVKVDNHFYQLVDTKLGLDLLIRKLLKQKEVCFDCETTSLDTFKAKLVGIAFSFEENSGYYVSFPKEKEDVEEILEKLKPFFQSDTILKIAHNLKYDLKVIENHGICVSGPFWDTMVAHYLIEPDMRHNMDLLSESYLNHKTISIESLIGKKGKNQLSFDAVPIEQQTEYAVEDADITFRLKKIFEKKIEKNKHFDLFNSVEMPLLEVLKDMEKEGINLDADALIMQSESINILILELEKEIFEIADSSFNINSPKQLGEVLFDKLKISEKAKKTKSGQYATSEDVLKKYAKDNVIVGKIMIHRQLQKLKSTYLDALPKQVFAETGRIHSIFSQTVAATGRLASNNPNLQNIPVRTEEGRRVREAFIPRDKEHVLLAADYSQIELRLIAALSKDPNMLKSFKEGEDIHAATAAKVFDVALDDVTREQRGVAKTVNFGIIYGVSAFGLSEQTDLNRTEAKEMIETYYKTYPTLKEYMNSQIEVARDNGFVETILGRRRYLPDILSTNSLVRSHAERNAVNTPVQGSAADIIKIAMIKIAKEIKKQNLQTRLLLQVHDELVFDVPKNELDALKPMIKDFMENAYEIDVPLQVDIGVGDNWLQAH